jgi:amino acid transporter
MLLKVGFVVGEMKDPLQDLPKTIKSSMSIALATFTLMVSSLYVVLPMSAIRQNETPVLVC